MDITRKEVVGSLAAILLADAASLLFDPVRLMLYRCAGGLWGGDLMLRGGASKLRVCFFSLLYSFELDEGGVRCFHL